MSSRNSQEFLIELDKKLWTVANRMRASLDAVVYKDAVLGLILLKYVSGSFTAWQMKMEAQLRDLKHGYFLDPAGYEASNAYEKQLGPRWETAITALRKLSSGFRTAAPSSFPAPSLR